MSSEAESLAHTMYWLEMTINQGKILCDWDQQPDEVKDKWRESAASMIRLSEIAAK